MVTLDDETSFIDIKDHKKRDARNLNEKAKDFTGQDDLQNMFNPVVESTEKSSKAAITEE